MTPRLLVDSKSMLGEGGCWHWGRRSFFWVDILEGVVYEKGLDGAYGEWSVDCYSSAVFEIKGCLDKVWVVSNKGLLRLCLVTGNYEIAHPLMGLAPEIRTNDAGVDPAGNLVYGTMYCDPSEGLGAVYRLNSSGGVDQLLSNICIPNTFQWSGDGRFLYLADSYKGVMYRYKYESGIALDQAEFFSLKDDVVPDGSAIDIDGFLWNACWNGAVVKRYDPAGALVAEVSLPVTRPTSCTFGERGRLYITSASVGMSGDQLKKEPLAGGVFLIQTATYGARRPLLEFNCKKFLRGNAC